MNIQFHFEHVSDTAKEEITDYAITRFEHLDTFLSTYQEDNKMLKVDIEHHERHSEYWVKCTLTLGGKIIHHEEKTHDPREAIDKSEGNLIRQAKKHIEILREKPHIEAQNETSEETEY